MQRFIQVILMFTFRVKMCVKQKDSNGTCDGNVGAWSIGPYIVQRTS